MGELFERTLPEAALDWTGERLTTGATGQVEIEHLHRYFAARALCRGLDVLDIASGEGYGAMLLAQVARTVVGVDVSAEAVAYASTAYSRPNLRFLTGDARSIPLPDSSVDVVVSFETLEHVYEHEQFIAEVRRVLRPGGHFIVSSPERDVYSPVDGPVNPYHVHELTREEFTALMSASFSYHVMLGQRPMLGSVLFTEGPAPAARTLTTFERRDATHFEASAGLPRPLYLVAIASDSPLTQLDDSVYVDTSNLDSLFIRLARAEQEAHELRERQTREAEQVVRLRQELARRETQLAELVDQAQTAQAARAELQNRDAEVAWLRAELQARSEEHALVVGSRSWKLTAPLREMAHGPSRGRARQAARLLRGVYRTLARPTGRMAAPASAAASRSGMPLPADATVLVATRGDDTLLQPYGPRGQPFPQSGQDPPDSLAAIAQLEALRARGASVLLVPSTAAWWLDHYVGFRRHLFRQYQLMPRPTDAGLLFNLREPSTLTTPIDRLLREVAPVELDGATGDGCIVLDWHTNLDLASTLSEHTVFVPPEAGPTLPYLAHSVDIVAVRNPDRAATAEAHRVASRAVVIFTDQPGRVGAPVATHIEPSQPSAAGGLPSASIIVPCVPVDPTWRTRLTMTCASIPAGFQGELLVAAPRASSCDWDALRELEAAHTFVRVLETDVPGAARQATADALVFLADDALPLPDWLAALLRTLAGSPSVAVVGGRVVGSDGRLREAGGLLSQPGGLEVRGAGHIQPDDPAYSFVRDVDWCSRSVLATWRGVFDELGGFDPGYRSDQIQDADYCFRVRRAGHRVVYQPASVVIRLGVATPAPQADDTDRQVLAERWRGAAQLAVAG